MTVDELITELTRIRDAGGGDRIIVAASDAEENGYNLVDAAYTCISEPYPRESGDVHDEEPDEDDWCGPSDEAVPAVLLK